MPGKRVWQCVCVCFAICCSACAATENEPRGAVTAEECLKVARAYADTMIEHGRDVYGQKKSPLFATMMDRTTYEVLDKVLPVEGIRSTDQVAGSANPMQDENLYLVLYALTTITGDKTYSKAADEALAYFFSTCQSKETGLMAWGEHLAWNLTRDECQTSAGWYHEFNRHWALWGRCFDLAKGGCLRFARGLWDHQIYDKGKCIFSRHALYQKHGPQRNMEFPYDSGYYVNIWSHAWQKTKDPEYLKAIDCMVNAFNRARHPVTDDIPWRFDWGQSEPNGWVQGNLTQIRDFHDAASRLPDELARKLIDYAERYDKVFLRLNHELPPRTFHSVGGRGFVFTTKCSTLEPAHNRPFTDSLWQCSYGRFEDANLALLCYERYKQNKSIGYKALVLKTAERYMNSEPQMDLTIYPRVFSDVILLMLAANELTGDKKYLVRADQFARIAIDTYFGASALPAASNKNGHYDAITFGDSLPAALLRLWKRKTNSKLDLGLVFLDVS
jgi:hypothetical protein